MKAGKISVHTENIFPIIKKFLYTDHEVFLRELVSNAVDATQKLKAFSSIGEFKGKLGELKIEIQLDTKENTLSIIDRGIGLTEEEIEKYINQLAFSGAEEFLKQYKDKTDTAVIGHFGLGFYSAFMVSKKVEINSLSYKEGSKPAFWECEGNTDIKMGKGAKSERGTEVKLYLADDSLEFANSYRIKTILEKYCSFLPVPVEFEGKIINEKEPVWIKKPQDLKDEDYSAFYKDLYPLESESLFYIHLNVDYPFNLTGVLYFPKISNRFEPDRHKVQLYSNQVFVTENVKDILPDYLVMLQGVIDSPDIPLNVSRSALQSDSNVKKITGHISKKVTDKLSELFKNDRKDFEQKWEFMDLFIKYGIVSDDKFYERAVEFCLLKDTEANFYTISEYLSSAEVNQQNKDKKTIALYTTDTKAQVAYIKQAEKKGYKVLVFDGPVDSYFIGKLEEKNENVLFKRVDSDSLDKLIDKGLDIESTLTKEQESELKSLFESLEIDIALKFEPEAMGPDNPPLVITENEYDRRFREMTSERAMFQTQAFNTANIVKINLNHPTLVKLLNTKKNKNDTARHLLDLALLSKNMLSGKDMLNFIDRSVKIVLK